MQDLLFLASGWVIVPPILSASLRSFFFWQICRYSNRFSKISGENLDIVLRTLVTQGGTSIGTHVTPESLRRWIHPMLGSNHRAPQQLLKVHDRMLVALCTNCQGERWIRMIRGNHPVKSASCIKPCSAASEKSRQIAINTIALFR